MRKILTIAAREYRAMVATKAFLLSIIMMPVLMFGGIIAMKLLQENKTIEDKKIAVIDHTGFIFGPLKLAADANNARLEETAEDETTQNRGFRFSEGIRYELELIDAADFGDSQRLELSDRVRSRELFAYLEIPKDTPDPDSDAEVKFYSQDSGLSEARSFFRSVISEVVKGQRMQLAGLNPEIVAKATKPVNVLGLGLIEQSADGEIIPATEKDELTAIFLPMGVM
ncbi:MAG: hypothetical protein AAGF97_19505, partial [Planctomycetota bacterium]